MKLRTRHSWVFVAALPLAGCSSDGSSGGSTRIEPLDPDERHYGGSYADWAGEFWRWVGEVDPTDDCAEPIGDETGELCTMGQDPDSEVFFLGGTWGGAVERTECAVPEDKALFFPLVASTADNGGVPEDQWDDLDALEARANSDLDNIPTGDLELSIDGREIEDLDRFRVEAAPYAYTLPEDWNLYDCFGSPDETGTYEGFIAGYFIMLPPLPAGEHVIEFGGVVEAGGDFNVRATYDPLTVE